jgi:phosphoserine phosphatase RsbU/P
MAGKDTVLARMLDAAHELPPWLVPEFARLHAEKLGAVRATIYLQDYDQREMLPLTDEALAGREVHGMSIDDSEAGRAFMQTTAVVSECEGGSRLYLPLLDGTARVGVLEIVTAEPVDAEQWTAFAAVVAELIVAKGAHTDVYFLARRRRPMGLAAEMQWRLLPPLTVSDPRVTIAGVVEPAYEVGGDAFDYAINHGTAHLAIFDAMGHGVDASVMATVAVGAYRHARRGGVPLNEMYTAVGTAFAAEFGHERFVTAHLGTLDLATGQLVLVNAGHPPPWHIRGNKVLHPIEGAPALPLGLGDAPPAVVQVGLEPGDLVLLYSDGVVDASRGDEHYDEEHLRADVEHVLQDDVPLAETVRRLNHRLMKWRGGQTRDDATLMLVEWRSPELPRVTA